MTKNEQWTYSVLIYGYFQQQQRELPLVKSPIEPVSLLPLVSLPPSLLQLCLVNSIASAAASLNDVFVTGKQSKDLGEKIKTTTKKKGASLLFFFFLPPLILDDDAGSHLLRTFFPDGWRSLIAGLNPNQKGLLKSH